MDGHAVGRQRGSAAFTCQRPRSNRLPVSGRLIQSERYPATDRRAGFSGAPRYSFRQCNTWLAFTPCWRARSQPPALPAATSPPRSDAALAWTDLDASGTAIRKYPKKKEDEGEGGGEEDFFSRGGGAGDLPADAGLNRFVWDLRYEGATPVPHAPLWGGGTEGPEAVPGKYSVRLTVLGKSYTAPLEIVPDPRLKLGPDDLAKQFDLLIKIRDKVTEVDDAIIEIRDLREQIKAVDKRLKNDPRGKTVAASPGRSPRLSHGPSARPGHSDAVRQNRR